MSRLDRNSLKENPCVKFLKWKTIKEEIEVDGEKLEKIKGGFFTWYDKENEKDVIINMPFKFAMINSDLVNFKGFDENKGLGVWSNEVSDPEHIVNIRNKEGKLLSFPLGDYKKNKDTIKGLGAKYGKSVYIAVEEDNGFELWNLQLSGSSLSGALSETVDPEEKNDGWFNFTRNNKNKLYSHFLQVVESKNKKKGTTKFSVPVFGVAEEIDEKTGKQLDDLDAQLKEYLDYYFAKTEAPANKEEEQGEEVAEYNDSLPFDE